MADDAPLMTLPYSVLPTRSPTRQVLVRWEKLRLLYNAILVVMTVLLISLFKIQLWASIEFWGMCVVGAVGANICYCAGPYAELWFHEWKPSGVWPTTVLFTLGMMFAILVTLICCFVVQFIIF